MKHTTRTPVRVLPAGILVGLLLAAGSPAQTPPNKPAAPGKLLALLVIDTGSDSLMPDVQLDRKNLHHILARLPAGRQQIETLRTAEVRPRELEGRIVDYYKKLKVGPDDALLLFYAGHGKMTLGEDKKEHHWLTPCEGHVEIARDKILSAMEAKRPRLTMLLTDCCSTFPRLHTGKGRDAVPCPDGISPVFQHLFFQHRGVVDITAADNGTSAYGDDLNGGCFTHALVQLLNEDLARLDTNRDGRLTWQEFFVQLQKRTDDNFKILNGLAAKRDEADARAGKETPKRPRQTSQRPRMFRCTALAVQNPSDAPRLARAGVGFINETGAPVRYKCRWSDEEKWTVINLPRKSRKVHSRTVNAGAAVPSLEWVDLEDNEQQSLKPFVRDDGAALTAQDKCWIAIKSPPKKPRAPADELKVYAAVTLENRAREVWVYRWRWAGESRWNYARLAGGGSRLHELRLPDDCDESRMPSLEVQTEESVPANILKPLLWIGDDVPKPSDGRVFALSD